MTKHFYGLTANAASTQFTLLRIDEAEAKERIVQFEQAYNITTTEFLSTFTYDRNNIDVNWDFNLWYECAEFLGLVEM